MRPEKRCDYHSWAVDTLHYCEQHLKEYEDRDLKDVWAMYEKAVVKYQDEYSNHKNEVARKRRAKKAKLAAKLKKIRGSVSVELVAIRRVC